VRLTQLFTGGGQFIGRASLSLKLRLSSSGTVATDHFVPVAVIRFEGNAPIYGPIRSTQRGVGKNDAIFSMCPHDRRLSEQKTFLPGLDASE
jgi:hypothetical protein